MKRFAGVSVVIVLLWVGVTVQGELYTWGGAGSADALVWWNDTNPDDGNGVNGDPSHWGTDVLPKLDGTDSVVLPGGGLKKSQTNIDGASTFRILGGTFWTGGFNVGKTTPGPRVTIDGGAVDAQWMGVTEGSIVEIIAGSLNLRGGAYPLPTAEGTASNWMTGFIDFVGASGTITMPKKDAAYIEQEVLKGSIRIDGQVLAGLDQVVNGRSFVLDGTTLTLVPEPTSLVLFGLGMGLLGLRRRR